MAFEDEPEKEEKEVNIVLTRDQELLLFTMDYLAKWVRGGDHFLETDNEIIIKRKIQLI